MKTKPANLPAIYNRLKKILKKYFGTELLKTLKGKSCFHITSLDEILIRQIEDALEKGFSLYKERDWI